MRRGGSAVIRNCRGTGDRPPFWKVAEAETPRSGPIPLLTYVQEVCTLGSMAVETTYTNLRERLADFLDQVAEDQEVVIVKRRGSDDVALVPARELAGLMETAHLLRSPKNAQRLLTALQRATKRKGKPESLDKLRRELGLSPAR